MEQKISFEIIAAIMREPMHARAIAKKLGTNHMAVVRGLKALVVENAVDFQAEGRNKVYFPKKSLEARNFAVMAELYRLNKTIEKYPELRAIIESIQKNPKIGLAMLFGSYAKGIARTDSDIDIFIESEDRKIKQEIELLNSKLIVKIGSYDRDNLLIKEIEKNHVMIKGAETYYERNRFFY
ncbi:MAG: nucleotidyltransferase domain-containing protein [Nanoarchaeota archaeon]|nr:nucleotidyltransferase domain-containing protein [archaeon]